MTAYFSSKLTSKIKVAFTATVLAFCLLGTQAIGLSHSISHSHLQSQSEVSSISSDSAPSLNHTSDVCHLFDALTLAGFIPSDVIAEVINSNFTQQYFSADSSIIVQASIEHYQSRAPPILLS